MYVFVAQVVRKTLTKKEEKYKCSALPNNPFSLFNSCKKDYGRDLYFGMYLEVHDSRWTEKHAPIKTGTIVQYSELIGFIVEADDFNGNLCDYMIEFQEIKSSSDRHYPVFGHWLFSKYEEDYSGFDGAGKKMSLTEMLKHMREYS